MAPPRGGRPARLTDHQKATVATRYKAGESMRTIAKDLGCSYGTVHKAVWASGVPVRRRGGSRPRRRAVSRG